MSQTVLITGCSSGIGRATAKRFRADGWTVYATARDCSSLSDLAADGCRTAILDVTDQETIDAVVEDITENQGTIDCLVNNAGVVSIEALEEMAPEAFADIFEVNVFGPHRLIRAVTPQMRERQQGHIINVGSVGGRFPVPLEGAYCASKFALRALTATLRDELRPFGVSVVLIEPPYIRTKQAEQEIQAANGRADSPYSTLYDRFERGARKEYDSAPGPDVVANKILAAATTDTPRSRYPVGSKAWVQGFLGQLPPRLRYRLWAWNADH